jgi:hypothetical protein
VVDVQEGALGALEHDVRALLDLGVQDEGGVGDEGPELLAPGEAQVEGLRGIGQVLAHLLEPGRPVAVQGLEAGAEIAGGAEEIDHADAAAAGLVLVAGADAAQGRADEHRGAV